VDIDSGTADGVAIGGGTPAAGAFTTLGANGDVTLGSDASDAINFNGDTVGDITPNVDDTNDLGSVSQEFQDLFIDGTANIDSLAADTADIDAGTFDGIVGGSTPAAGTFTDLVSTGNTDIGDAATDTVTITADIDSDIIPAADDTYDLGDGSNEWQDAFFDGTVTTDSLAADTADIDAGTFDGIVGGSTPAAGSFTNVDASGTLNADGTITLGTADTGDTTVEGDLTVDQNEVVTGTMDVDGTTNLDGLTVDEGGVTVTSGVVSVDDATQSTSGTTGSVHTDGGLGVAKDAFIVGKADIGGAFTADGTITLGTADTGDTTVQGDLTVDQNADITGTLSAGTFEPDSLVVNDDNGAETATAITIGDGVNDPDGILAYGDGDFRVDLNADGTVTLGTADTGDTTVEGDLTVDQNEVVTGTMDVDGTTNLDGLTVDEGGVTVTSGVVSVDDATQSTSGTTGSVHTDGGLGVAKDAFIVGQADIGGAFTADGTITLGTADTGDTTVQGDLTVDQNEVVTGTMDVDGTTNLDGLTVDEGGVTVTSGVVSVDDATQSTSGTTGSVHTDGGLGVAKDAFIVGKADIGGAFTADGTITLGTADTGDTTVQGDLTVDQNAAITGTHSASSYSGDGSSVTNVDATTIDGVDSTAIVQADGSVAMTGALDLDGQELIIDGDGDTSITADTDDQLDIKVNGADDFTFGANTFTAEDGSKLEVEATGGASNIFEVDGAGPEVKDSGTNTAWDVIVVPDGPNFAGATAWSSGASEIVSVSAAGGGSINMNGPGTINAPLSGASFQSVSGDGSGVTNVDATSVDGIDSTSLAQSDGSVAISGGQQITMTGGTGGYIQAQDGGGTTASQLDGDGVVVYDTSAGGISAKMDDTGIIVYDAGSGLDTITLEQDGTGTFVQTVITGSDVAEDFEDKHGNLEVGDVVVITDGVERLERSKKPYDTMVAGIVSSNESIAVHMGKGKTLKNRVPLALNGVVLAKASNENGLIKPGDLLTTSLTPGHVMKCERPSKCFGSLVGKALERLDNPKGKIKILVALH